MSSQEMSVTRKNIPCRKTKDQMLGTAREAILALLHERDFLGYQLSHAHGGMSDEQLEQIVNEHEGRPGSDPSDLTRKVVCLTLVLGPHCDRIDSELVATIFKCGLDEAEASLSEAAKEMETEMWKQKRAVSEISDNEILDAIATNGLGGIRPCFRHGGGMSGGSWVAIAMLVGLVEVPQEALYSSEWVDEPWAEAWFARAINMQNSGILMMLGNSYTLSLDEWARRLAGKSEAEIKALLGARDLSTLARARGHNGRE